jgi:hypothetical protein
LCSTRTVYVGLIIKTNIFWANRMLRLTTSMPASQLDVDTPGCGTGHDRRVNSLHVLIAKIYFMSLISDELVQITKAAMTAP